jgi:hypothetical protein
MVGKFRGEWTSVVDAHSGRLLTVMCIEVKEISISWKTDKSAPMKLHPGHGKSVTKMV